MATEPVVLVGLGASAGRRRGVARVIARDADLQHVRAGEVVIASSMRPELVLAFDRAAAVVTDVGGRLSHAALVARDLGLPAVVAVTGATSCIQCGDLVVVDGRAGTVAVVSR